VGSDATLAGTEPDAADTQLLADPASDFVDTDATNALARQLEQIVESVSVVEELSRRAREVASTDLALYDALQASHQQYSERLGQACAIRDQALEVHQRAFGHEAKSAAEPMVADAERVVQAFTHLSDAWYRRAC